MKHDDHNAVLESLGEAQKADHDMREQGREARLFLSKRDGMWEPYWWNQNDGKPRYSFDLTNPIVDQINGDIEKKDFQIRITPGSGDATEEGARVYDGLIRSIEDFSKARATYLRSAKESVCGGISGWRVVQKYIEGDSFDQDLMIERIGNFSDRVWFGPHEEPDASDAGYCFVLTAIGKEDFKSRWPDRACRGVESDKTGQAFYHSHDQVVVGEYLYLKDEPQTLVLMSDGSVHREEDLEPVLEELAQAGIVEQERRERMTKCCYSRKFDGEGFIGEPEKTVFRMLPVVPLYANFDYIEDKVVYQSAVERLMDPQRVFNYSLSREIEEGALAPRAKYWMTAEQAAGWEESLSSMNTNSDPVQFFNPDENLPGPPMQQGGAQINPGLRTISEAMQVIVGQAAGMFAANMGDNPGLQSGKAIEALQDRGDQGNNKYVTALECALSRTAEILVDSIPRVYLKDRQVRLLREDGSWDIEGIGKVVLDNETGKPVPLYDLNAGTYMVSCSSGPSFKSRQSETVAAITEIASVNPAVIELGGDVLLNNINSPGMDQIAERVRQMLLNQGAIPFDQMSEEEQQQAQAAAMQPPPEDPMMVAARAEEKKAQSELIDKQNDAAKIQGEMNAKIEELRIKDYESVTKRIEAMIERARAVADVGVKNAQTAKLISDAEAQSIENDAVESGMAELLERANGLGNRVESSGSSDSQESSGSDGS